MRSFDKKRIIRLLKRFLGESHAPASALAIFTRCVNTVVNTSVYVPIILYTMTFTFDVISRNDFALSTYNVARSWHAVRSTRAGTFSAKFRKLETSWLLSILLIALTREARRKSLSIVFARATVAEIPSFEFCLAGRIYYAVRRCR